MALQTEEAIPLSRDGRITGKRRRHPCAPSRRIPFAIYVLRATPFASHPPLQLRLGLRPIERLERAALRELRLLARGAFLRAGFPPHELLASRAHLGDGSKFERSA
jgi:hypothetical protein